MAVFSEQLKEILLATQPMAGLASGGKMVVFRCPYCGDSRNPKSKHFYVSLGYDEPVSLGYCHKCNTGILVSNETLASWGIYDVNLGVMVSKAINQAKRNPNSKYRMENKPIFVNNTIYTPSDLTTAKANYINRRLGTNMSIEEMLKNKIVLNIYDFLNENHINKLTRNERDVDELNRAFLGFISKDNCFINMKNLLRGKVLPSVDRKYLNYNTFGKIDNTERFYIVPTTIDLNKPERVRVNICEGAFDALSIHYNLLDQMEHSIVVAITGCGYFGVLDVLLSKLNLFHSEFHFYKDNDINNDIFYIIARRLKTFNIDMYLHVNTMEGQKDFGVRKELIKEEVYKL